MLRTIFKPSVSMNHNLELEIRGIIPKVVLLRPSFILKRVRSGYSFRLDYQPLFGKMSPHSSPRNSGRLFRGGTKTGLERAAEIEPSIHSALSRTAATHYRVLAPFSTDTCSLFYVLSNNKGLCIWILC